MFGSNNDPEELKKNNPDSITGMDFNSMPWYERVSWRGYAQLRYNRLFETNPDLKCEQCDRSWGDGGGFFFRRIRMVFFGDIHEKIYMYIQPDFASGGNNMVQIRDAYFDLALDDRQEFRIRLGQSKVPFGFENMQSSQNRIPLDRNDGINSAVANERDIGLFAYWAPRTIRRRFAYLVRSGLKGSGDYGVVGFGVYNGQTANSRERTESPHYAARVTYPFMLKSGQFIEGSFQGYKGEFVVNTNLTDNRVFEEARVGATLVVYPQPFGFQAEYNIGYGPEYDPSSNTIKTEDLRGGYMQVSYFLKAGKDMFIPFARWHTYEGGKKHELDATRHRVNEQEVGVEWQPNPNFELVAMYTFSHRTAENSLIPMNRESGSLLRLQAQVNF